MNRPLHIWTVFTGCLLLLLGAMGWVTWHTLRLERERQATTQEAQKQDLLRLALWRLDFQASTLVIRENARPPQDFRAFHAPEGFFGKDNKELKKGEVLAPSPLLGAPPELVVLHFQLDAQGRASSPQVPAGNVRTLALDNYLEPADLERCEDRLRQLQQLLMKPGHAAVQVSQEGPAEQKPKAPLPAPAIRPDQPLAPGIAGVLSNGQMLCAWNFSPPSDPEAEKLLEEGAKAPLQPLAQQRPANDQPLPPPQGGVPQGVQISQVENLARNRAVEAQKLETLPQQVFMKDKAPPPKATPKPGDGKNDVGADDKKKNPGKLAKPSSGPSKKGLADNPPPGQVGASATPRSEPVPAPSAPVAPAAPVPVPSEPPTGQPQGTVELLDATQPSAAAPAATAKPLQGFWIDDTLLLTREATLDGVRVLQGVWLDWPKLSEQWLAQVRDLFPHAKLELAPNLMPGEPVPDDPQRLASLPVRLLTGPFTVAAAVMWTPLRTSLAVAWLCVGLAGVAVALVLHGTIALSERRAAFVSAVTHELRTPLTTFRLYSEMLASGMVQEEEQKKTYLGTLEAEAGRLSHLVENVLAYARIEKGSARAQVEKVTIGDILDRILPRLKQRAEQAGMEVVVDASDADRKAFLRVDVSALEQILFNLVDNACKYAAPRAAEKTIHLQATTRGPLAMLRVRDHGAGIAPRERRRVFRAFHKSADQAAHSAPGVGLGLALCERLSRELGGKLSLEKLPDKGASFVLELPTAE